MLFVLCQSKLFCCSLYLQIVIFKKFCERKPQTILDPYAHMVKKRPSYVQMPSTDYVKRLKLWERAKLQDCSSDHNVL